MEDQVPLELMVNVNHVRAVLSALYYAVGIVNGVVRGVLLIADGQMDPFVV